MLRGLAVLFGKTCSDDFSGGGGAGRHHGVRGQPGPVPMGKPPELQRRSAAPRLWGVRHRARLGGALLPCGGWSALSTHSEFDHSRLSGERALLAPPPTPVCLISAIKVKLNCIFNISTK